jgi:MarR family transcriptional regulator, organic hydroperoxide resistance regulator
MNGAFLDDYLPYLLGHASHVMNKDLDETVRATGLSPIEWRTLATLSDRDGRTIGELGRIVVGQQPTLTKAVKRLHEIGLVRREDDGEDLRKTRAFVTPRGRKLAAELMRVAREHERAMVAALTPAQQRALKDALRAILQPRPALRSVAAK